MGFTRFVEIGRVCLINFGADAGKLCTIVDILDGQRVGKDCVCVKIATRLSSVVMELDGVFSRV
jgi:hypothetical protein